MRIIQNSAVANDANEAKNLSDVSHVLHLILSTVLQNTLTVYGIQGVARLHCFCLCVEAERCSFLSLHEASGCWDCSWELQTFLG